MALWNICSLGSLPTFAAPQSQALGRPSRSVAPGPKATFAGQASLQRSFPEPVIRGILQHVMTGQGQQCGAAVRCGSKKALPKGARSCGRFREQAACPLINKTLYRKILQEKQRFDTKILIVEGLAMKLAQIKIPSSN